MRELVPGLSSGSRAVDAERLKAFGRAVDGRCQPRRTSSDHEQIEAPLRQVLEGETQEARKFAGSRVAQDGPGRDHHRQFARSDARLAEKPLNLGIGIRVEPFV